MNTQKPFLENPYLIIPAAVPLLDQPMSPLRCSFCSFFNKLVFATSKTSDSSLFPYQEPRPTKEDALWPFPNLVTILISDRPQLEGERVICKNFIESRVPWVTIWNQVIFRRGDGLFRSVCLHLTCYVAIVRTFCMGFLQYLVSVKEELATVVLLGKKKCIISFESHLWEIISILGEKGKRRLWVVFFLISCQVYWISGFLSGTL